ncbi:MAG: TetR/AcrR family transcriptional regulator [Actinomycetes bacterium]
MSVVASLLAPVGQVRLPGRPRDQRVDRAIVDSTLQLIADVGPSALSMEEVATRAGVSKATLYRRFATKDDLVVAALASLNELLPTELPIGSARDVLVYLIDIWCGGQPDSLSAQLFPRVFAHARSNPRMFGSFYDNVLEPRRDVVRGAIRRGIARGEFRSDTDIELLTTLLIAPSVYTAQVRAGGRDCAPQAMAADFVDAVLAGFTISK